VKIVLLIARLILGAIFLYAAWVKLREPWWMFAASIDSYQMLPPAISIFIARTLPWLELLLGALLVIGFRLRWVAATCGVLLLVFWISMLRAWMKGMEIDCGCFGPGEAVSPVTLLRDGAMIALAAFVAWGTTRTPSNAYRSATGQNI
jgi:putative oxidoreductase